MAVIAVVIIVVGLLYYRYQANIITAATTGTSRRLSVAISTIPRPARMRRRS
jgi:hypothetical protein